MKDSWFLSGIGARNFVEYLKSMSLISYLEGAKLTRYLGGDSCLWKH